MQTGYRTNGHSNARHTTRSSRLSRHAGFSVSKNQGQGPIAARDATCTAPGCGQPATRSQLDHITPYPHGPSDTTNTHTLCKRDHDTKTAGDITITEHHADGSCHWRTRHGQTGTTDPRPYLPPPLPDSHDPAPDDPPPF
jgi:hypothetical protein